MRTSNPGPFRSRSPSHRVASHRLVPPYPMSGNDRPMIDFHRENIARVTRRQFFGSATSGVGMAALATLMGGGSARGADRARGESGLPGLPHFAPKAKRVVILWQGGGPSHVDLFDPKPVMRAMAGKDIPDGVRGMTRLSTMSSGYGKWPTLPAIKPFKKYGQSGVE